MMTFFKLLGIVVAAVLGVLVFWFVILPIVVFCFGLCFSVLWGIASVLAFLAKIAIFVGLLAFICLLLLRVAAWGLELILY